MMLAFSFFICDMANDESGTSFNPMEEFSLVFKEVQEVAVTINAHRCQCLLYRWKQVDGYFLIWTSVFKSEVNEVSLVLKEIIRLLKRTLDLFKHWNRRLHWLRQVNNQEFQVIYKDLNRYIDIVRDWILKNVSKGQSTSLSERITERILSDQNYIESYQNASFEHDKIELKRKTSGVPQQDESFIFSQHILRIMKDKGKSEIPFIEHEKLQVDKQIGKGAYGKVYAGTWLGEDIAIKEYEKDDLSYEAEVEAFAEIQDCDPHVLQAIGRSDHCGKKRLVLELMKMDLERLLRQQKILPFFVSLSIILQVVRAMKYLHDKDLMHRDLKPRNILVSFSRESVDDIIDTDHISVKMTDFGTAKRTLNDFSDMTSNRGTTNYMAPEVLGVSYNKKADVYSFGITCCEIFGGSVYRDARRNPSPRTINYPKGLPEELDNLIRQCCNVDHELRPTFDFIEKQLQHIQQTELLKPANSSCVVSTESSNTGKVEISKTTVEGRPIVIGKPFVGGKLSVEASVPALYKWVRTDGVTEPEIVSLHLAEPSNMKVLNYHLTAEDVDKTIALEYLDPENPMWIKVDEIKIRVDKKMLQGIDHYYKQEEARFSIKELGKGVFPFWQKRKGTLIINKTDYLLFWDKGSPLNKRITFDKSMATNPPIKISKSDLRTCTISGNGTSWEVQFCKDEDRDLAILTMNRFLGRY